MFSLYPSTKDKTELKFTMTTLHSLLSKFVVFIILLTELDHSFSTFQLCAYRPTTLAIQLLIQNYFTKIMKIIL